jgi:hypothetical protein
MIGLQALTTTTHAQTSTPPRFGVGSYLGGNATDYGEAIGRDAQGNLYLGISTLSSSLGGDTLNRRGEADILIAKLSPDRKTLLDENSPGVLLQLNATMDDLVFSTFTDFTVAKQTNAVGVDNAGNIHRGDVSAHHAWMIRNYAATFGAVTLRLWLGLFIALGVEFDTAYRIVAWLSWAPNVLIAQVVFVARATKR